MRSLGSYPFSTHAAPHPGLHPSQGIPPTGEGTRCAEEEAGCWRPERSLVRELRGAMQGQEAHQGGELCTWFFHSDQKGSFIPSSFFRSLLSSMYPFDRWEN